MYLKKNLSHYHLSQDIECSFPCCSRATTLLFIHSLYNSLHLLIPNAQSILLPLLLPLGDKKPVLYVCESFSVSFVSYLRFHI